MKPPESVYAPTGGNRGEWLGDVIYLRDYKGVNKQRMAIFTLMEANSRHVYARALPKATAANVAEAMEKTYLHKTGQIKRLLES